VRLITPCGLDGRYTHIDICFWTAATEAYNQILESFRTQISGFIQSSIPFSPAARRPTRLSKHIDMHQDKSKSGVDPQSKAGSMEP
jgi:hypothetical protein